MASKKVASCKRDRQVIWGWYSSQDAAPLDGALFNARIHLRFRLSSYPFASIRGPLRVHSWFFLRFLCLFAAIPVSFVGLRDSP
jgi:hypothetical protein